jgi:hypothetical protein
MGLKTQQEIDEWHEFCRAQDDPEIKSVSLVCTQGRKSMDTPLYQQVSLANFGGGLGYHSKSLELR